MAIKRIYSKDTYYTINDKEIVSNLKEIRLIRKKDEERYNILIKEFYNQLRKILNTDCFLAAAISKDEEYIDVILFEEKANELDIFTEVKIDNEKEKFYIEIKETID